jgi:hypothetical protein
MKNKPVASSLLLRAKVALEAVKNQHSLAELAKKFKVSSPEIGLPFRTA